jgi:CRISPR-associated protein Cas1
MGTLYIDRKEIEVRADGKALAFYANGEREGLVPIGPLKRVVIVGDVALRASALHRLAEEGVPVVFLSGKRQAFRARLHGRLHNNALLRLRQYEQSRAPFARTFAVELVSRKLEGQRVLLLEAAGERPGDRTPLLRAAGVLERVLEKIRHDTPGLETLRGLEGGAAASYFKALPVLFPDSLGFTGRNRRPPEDPVNALLSLTYTLVHYEAVREMEVIGLDPCVGFLHEFDYGRESLACDLVEPRRPLVDRWVWELSRTRQFTARDFSTDDERPGCYLKKGARARFYPLYEEWAGTWRSTLVAEVEALARRILDGQDAVPDREPDDARQA